MSLRRPVQAGRHDYSRFETMKTLFSFLLAAALGAIFSSKSQAQSEPSSPDSKPLDYMILVTGGEVLEGAYADAHTYFLTSTLRPLGCRCVGSMTVDDRPDQIKRALGFATRQVPLVIVTGGLGPTPNDITRETISEFTDIPLHEHPQAVAEMERRFGEAKDRLRPNLRRQTMVPVRGGYLKNPNGSAVGLVFDDAPRSQVIVALPGPPRELQGMVRNELVPFLRHRFGVRTFGASLTLRFVGAGQSLIDQTINERVKLDRDVVVTSQFEASRVDFTFSVAGNTPEDHARLQRLKVAIREHLGDYLYADDGATLEEIVARELQARGRSLVIVEIGSGGNLAVALGGANRNTRLLAGSYAAPSLDAMAQVLRIPSSRRAAWKTDADRINGLTTAAVESLPAECGIGVGPVEVNEAGARSFSIAIKLPGAPAEVQWISIRESGEIHRLNLTTQILDALRRYLR